MTAGDKLEATGMGYHAVGASRMNGKTSQVSGPLTYERCRPFLERLLALLKARAGDVLVSVALYGSVARDRAKQTSDLDLLIIHSGHRRTVSDHFVGIWGELRGGPEYRTLEEQGFYPDPAPVFLSVEELAEHPWLLLDVVDDGIILLDRGDVLKEELAAVGLRLKALGSRKVFLPDGTWYWDLKPDWKPGDTIEI